MKLHTSFVRYVGAGLTPALGTDAVPSGLPLVGSAVDLTGIIARCVHSVINGNPVQRLGLFYHYAGGGPAPTVVVTAYVYVAETNSWFSLGSITLTTDVVGFLGVMGDVLPKKSTQPMDPGDAADTLEVVLVAAKPGGCPDGTFTFGAVFDTATGSGPITATVDETTLAKDATLKAGTFGALTALSDGANLSAVPIEYKTVAVSLDAGAAGWVQLHDAASLPANTAVPIASVYAIGPCVVRFVRPKFLVGANWCISSTMRTKTITAFTLACAGVEV